MPTIRNATLADAGAICGIYNHYIADTVITFEEAPVPPQEMQRRIAETTASFPWLVAEENGAVTGYAYASLWRPRSAYRFTAESTVYLHPDSTRKGIGSQLYEALIAELRNKKLHAVMGGIALPNVASVALHEKMGFVKVAHMKELGWKFGKWIDVGYWELLLHGSESTAGE